MTERTAYLTEHDYYYLRSIQRHLREVRQFADGHGTLRHILPTIGGEALADNIDWLDCFIYKHWRVKP